MSGPVHPLIDTAELSALLDSGQPPTLLDVRYRRGGPTGPAEHEAGHVPGAADGALDTALAAPPGAGGRHPLPDTATFVGAMRSAGVRSGHPVGVDDDWSGHAAARAWWLLRHHGVEDVRVLDGGWSAWVADGGPVETGPGDTEPGDLDGTPGSMPVVEADGALGVAVLVDARAGERYRGEVEPVEAPGLFDRGGDVGVDEVLRRVTAGHSPVSITPAVVVSDVVHQFGPSPGDHLSHRGVRLVDRATDRRVGPEVGEPCRPGPRGEPQGLVFVDEPDGHHSRHPIGPIGAETKQVTGLVEKLLPVGPQQAGHVRADRRG